MKGPESHATVNIVASSNCSTRCERSSTRSATPLCARFWRASVKAGSHESTATTRSAGQGARSFDGEPADASADVEKRYRDVGLWNRLERLRADRQSAE